MGAFTLRSLQRGEEMRRRRSEDASNRAEEFFLIGTIISRTIIAIFLVPFECSLWLEFVATITYGVFKIFLFLFLWERIKWTLGGEVSRFPALMALVMRSIRFSPQCLSLVFVQFNLTITPSTDVIDTIFIHHILRIFIFVSRRTVHVSFVHFDWGIFSRPSGTIWTEMLQNSTTKLSRLPYVPFPLLAFEDVDGPIVWSHFLPKKQKRNS